MSDGLNKAEKGKTYTFNVRVKDLSIHLERHERYLFILEKVDMAKNMFKYKIDWVELFTIHMNLKNSGVIARDVSRVVK